MAEIDAKRTAGRTKPDGTVRARAYHGYSRNGCARCKQQRVRCDERHPECERCVRVGAKCPGYEQKLRWSAKHEVFHSTTPASVTKAGRRKGTKAASRVVSAMPAAAAPQTALPSPQRSRSLSRSSQQETSPASLSSSSDTIELPAGSADVHSESMLLPTEPDSDSLHGSHVWDADSLDLLNQMAPSLVADVPDFLMGLDSSFLAGRKSPGMGMFLGGMMPDADTAAPAPFTEQIMSSVPPSIQQPTSVSFLPIDDEGFNDLWLGLAARRDDIVADLQDVSGSRNDHKQTTMFLDDNDDESLSPFDAEAPYQATVSRMRSPSPLSTSLNDVGSLLVEFYFKETAKIYSCYDGRMNPFRTAVVNLWTSSEIINCTAQSMAAACLSREFPQIASVGRQLRQEAIRILARTKTWDTHTMLAVLMLGGTASWHDKKDLGLQFFRQIAERLALAPASVFRQGGTDYSSYRFFYESMQYWEMQLAFLTDSETLPNTPESHLLSDRVYGRYSREEGRVQEEEEYDEGERNEDVTTAQVPQLPPGTPPAPHPWTGYATETQRAVQKVGRLIRRQRMFASSRRFASAAHIHELQQDMEAARALEAHLVAIAHPAAHMVRDTEDYNTPAWHLLTLAETIRHMGLIQLYHVFPDLLSARLRREGVDNAVFSSPSSRTDMHRRWLTKYALRTIDMVQTLPVESGTRVFHPFLLVTLSSELRTAASPATTFRDGPHSSIRLFNINRGALEVARARSFMLGRLRLFLHILPPKPMMVCLDIVRETWRQMDFQAKRRAGSGGPGSQEGARGWAAADSEADIYWMDVMIENGWETIMG